MSWSERKGICDRCKKNSDRLIPAFGKYICIQCKDSRPKKGSGNAGVGTRYITGHIPPSSIGVSLLKVAKSNGTFGKLFFEHYPGSKGIPGRSICFLIFWNGKIAGIIGVNSPPHNYKIFREYFSVSDDNCFMNNNVFRLIVHEQNLGTQVLRSMRETVKIVYEKKYNTKLLGLVTFVEPPRIGSVYKADNWEYLGMTKGLRMRRGDDWEKTYSAGEKKYIYGYKYK